MGRVQNRPPVGAKNKETLSLHKEHEKKYGGKVTCLKCDKKFKSWDKRKNRLCPACRHGLNETPDIFNQYGDEPCLSQPLHRPIKFQQ